MLELNRYLGAPIHRSDGQLWGKVEDVVVTGVSHPLVHALIGRADHRLWLITWDQVERFERTSIVMSTSVEPTALEARPLEELQQAQFLLKRDVLDTQIIDVAGTRVARVSDVLLDHAHAGQLEVVGVDVGVASVLSRLGLHRLGRKVPQKVVRWSDIHLTSDRGHELQLADENALVHTLNVAALKHLLAVVPAPDARQILDHLDDQTTQAVLADPTLARRLVLGSRRRFTRLQPWHRP